jgi:hypothetical protein
MVRKAQATIPPDQELRSLFSGLGGPNPAMLLELVPLLPEALLPRALEIALDIHYPAMDLRAHLVEELAKRIVEANPDVIRDALGIARANLLRNMETGAESALVMILAPFLREGELPAAFQIANHIWELRERRDAFLVLADCLPPEDAQAVFAEELDRARGIDRYLRSWVLSSLIPYLTDSLRPKALDIILEYQQIEDRVGLLTELLPYLSGEELRSASEAILSAVLSRKDLQWKAMVLTDLEPYLSEPDLVEKALAVAEKISATALRIPVLAKLAGHLTENERLSRVAGWKKTAYRLKEPHQKVAALTQIAWLLPSAERPPVLAEILEMARNLRTAEEPTGDLTVSDWCYPEARAEGLIDLARRLPQEERTEILKETLQEVQSVPDPDWRDQMVASIAELLPEPPPFPLTDQAPKPKTVGKKRRSGPEREAYSAIRHIQDESWYVDVVVDRLGVIPAERWEPIVTRTVKAISTLSSEDELGKKLAGLSPYLDDAHLEQALALARGIKDVPLRAGALVALARRFAGQKQPSLADEALTAVESMGDIREYDYLLGELAPVLSQAQKSKAFDKALEKMRAVPTSDLEEIWWSLAPHFPPDLMPQAWILAKSNPDKEARADALANLALSVPPEDRSMVLGDALQAILALGSVNTIYRYLVEGGLTLILPEPLIRQALSAVQQFPDDLERADIMAELLAGLAGFSTGEERWSILRAALGESLRAAVPRGGGKGGGANPEAGSESGERASELLQNLPESDAQALLEGWLGPLSPQTRQEMAPGGMPHGQKAKKPASGSRDTTGAELEEAAPVETIHGADLEELPPIETSVEVGEAAPGGTITGLVVEGMEPGGTVTGVSLEELTPKGISEPAAVQPKRAAQERVVNTGFALRSQPGQRLKSNTPLTAGEPYYFWFDVGKLDRLSIETQPSAIPVEVETHPVILHVVLYAFPNEIILTPGADIGALELQVDGSAIVKRQPGGQDATVHNKKLLKTRLYFPIQAPDHEGVSRLRCHIYYQQILIQARLVEAQVMRSPLKAKGALQSKLDYSLAQSLRPEHLARLQTHRLSLMLNDNGDTTHTLRFLGDKGGEPKKYDAHLLPTELEIPMLNARKTLWKVSWGNEEPWDPAKSPEQKYRYENVQIDLDRLETDLISLAVNGYILYNAIIDKLTGGRRASYELADLMHVPGLVQIALRQSPSQVIPAALFYDYDLNTQVPHKLCETFKAAMHDRTPLENTPCFQGACPSLSKQDADHIVCPSGFWGFRHQLGFPFSAVQGTDLPPEIIVHGNPQIVVGVAKNLDRVDEHMRDVQNIRADLGWHESEHTDKVLDMMKAARPHLIYFYCHGGVAKDVPFLQMGSGNEYFEGSNLRSEHIYWSDPQPLVFVNGCHTTALDTRQIISLVQDFIATGGAGVVGTEITIFETLACDFAEEFLTSFLKLHVSAGQSVRSARLKLLEKGNPLGLAYTPFVLPSLHLLG